MFLFVRRLPENVTSSELSRFVSSATSGWWHKLPFVNKPVVEKCEIIRIEDLEKESVEFHGLVLIQPAKVAVAIAKKLNGSKLHGKTMEVRKYFRRSPYKDRRRRHIDLEQLPTERRGQDRRRHKVNIRTLRRPKIEFEGLVDFSRTHV